MPDADLPMLLAFFKAMSNESRLRIVGLLAARERSVRELADLLGLKEPTVSHHLTALKSLGIVVARAEGVTRWHALRLEALSDLNRSLLEQPGVAGIALQPDEASEDERVVAGYLDASGRLTAIPASRRKRIAVLKWLVRQARGRSTRS
jgi:DNA-binding transcriptional ArsR family regulator